MYWKEKAGSPCNAKMAVRPSERLIRRLSAVSGSVSVTLLLYFGGEGEIKIEAVEAA